ACRTRASSSSDARAASAGPAAARSPCAPSGGPCPTPRARATARRSAAAPRAAAAAPGYRWPNRRSVRAAACAVLRDFFVIAGLDPAIHHSCEGIDARVKLILGPPKAGPGCPRMKERASRMSRMLITGGCVVTMDPQLGELPRGDVLIENGRIAAIAPSLPAPDGAEVIDAAGMIVMPGLVNGHLHTWQSALRGIAADWTVARYMQAMHRGLATLFRPEDISIANLMGALNQINAGATTLVDWCHNNPTPEHTDAAIDGLAESGIRAVFLHGSPN